MFSMMKHYTIFLVLLCLSISNQAQSQSSNSALQNSQWKGKKVAFLGDSMTQKKDSAYVVYWEYLRDMMGIEPYVYGISGNQWDGIYRQANKLKAERGSDIDAIFIFAGTNDYNHSLPLGEFYTYLERETNHNGEMVSREHRSLLQDDSTFCGRINKVMAFLKANYPDQQIIIMTPIHRAFAQFNEKNVQPGESYSNGQGLFLDSYVDQLKKAASIWAVPLIDLYSMSGLYPLEDAQVKYFRNKETDRLHPNSLGNLRLAKTIAYQLLTYPSDFRE